MKTLVDQIATLHFKRREVWRVEKEPHDYPDGTTHFNHVRYTSDIGEVEVASYVTPELGELLCILHNNTEEIVAALRTVASARAEQIRLSLQVSILTNERDEARAKQAC